MKELKAFNIRLPLDLWKRLKIHCVNHNVTISEYLINLIQTKLNEVEK